MSHIVRLTATDFKRLVAVNIEPDGRVVTISGRNGEGKTSVLDAITAALVGQKDFKLDRPIRDGADTAEVSVDVGDFTATRRWRAGNSSLELTLKNGAAVPNPRRVLDDLIGKLSFDPLAFAEADGKKQRTILLEVAGLTDADAQLSAERQRHYDARTAHGRDAKRLQAQVDGLPRPSVANPQRVDVTAVATELSQARADLAEFERLKVQVASIDKELAELAQRVADLQTTRQDMATRGRELMARDWEQMRQLEEQLAGAEKANEDWQRQQRREETVAELQASQAAHSSASNAVKAADQRRAELVAGAQLPIEGLSVDDDGVLLNGVPFSQASAAERLRTSVAMAMAMNPKLRVVRIADASLLDSVNRALIETMAEEHDFQIWLEVVDETRGLGFVIEDGQVAAHD